MLASFAAGLLLVVVLVHGAGCVILLGCWYYYFPLLLKMYTPTRGVLLVGKLLSENRASWEMLLLLQYRLQHCCMTVTRNCVTSMPVRRFLSDYCPEEW